VSYQLHFSSEAERCIEEQLEWYDRETDHEQGDRWLAQLEAALERLSGNPERYGFAPENGLWRPELELRQMPFQPWKTKSAWRVLYVIDESSEVVTVIQIRHSRRPWLSEEESS